MAMRRISGTVVMPPDAPVATATMVLELRDTSWADAPAPQIAVASFPGITVSPGRHQDFEMYAPELAGPRRLSLRCQLRMSGPSAVGPGQLRSVESIPVACTGDVTGVSVRVFAV
jgi:hypothetical protein